MKDCEYTHVNSRVRMRKYVTGEYGITFLGAALLMSLINIGVILRQKSIADFQMTFFYTSVVTGWVLLGGLMVA